MNIIKCLKVENITCSCKLYVESVINCGIGVFVGSFSCLRFTSSIGAYKIHFHYGI